MKSFSLLAVLLAFIPLLTAASLEDSPNETENEELSREKRQTCPTITFPCSRMPTVCANMRNAINRRGKPTRLNRITDQCEKEWNSCRSGCRHLPRRPGYNCDEYPFASTSQGGSGAVIKLVRSRENSRQGGLLGAFYKRNNIGDGDCFNVRLG